MVLATGLLTHGLLTHRLLKQLITLNPRYTQEN